MFQNLKPNSFIEERALEMLTIFSSKMFNRPKSLHIRSGKVFPPDLQGPRNQSLVSLRDNDKDPVTIADILRDASYSLSVELEALQTLNTRQAVKEVAELYNLRPIELWYYFIYGEPEAEALFQVSRPASLPKADDPVSVEW